MNTDDVNGLSASFGTRKRKESSQPEKELRKSLKRHKGAVATVAAVTSAPRILSIHRGEYLEVCDGDFTPSFYMRKQKDITPRMRAILVDWIIEVHHSLNLQPAALWLCVNILDRFLENHQCARNRLQLVGISALRIASQLDFLNFPLEAEFCVHITAHAFEKNDVIEMERQILKEMNFQIPQTSYHVLQRYLDIINAPELIRLLSLYYMDRNLQEYDSLAFSPQKYTCAAIFSALHQQVSGARLGSGESFDVWPAVLVEETGFTPTELAPVASLILSHVREEPTVTASKRVLNATRRKYDSEKYQYIARLNLPII